MIGFPLGLLASNATEWWIHKHVLHGLGRHKSSTWSFHWHEHHKESRRNGFRDADYERSPLLSTPCGARGWNAQAKEVAGLVGISLAVLPLVSVAPYFCAAVWASSYYYYAVHKKAHLDPKWARSHLRWHYDHHMGPNQDANWCVTSPLWDHVMKTRVPYAGTERERIDRERLAAQQARSQARATA